LLLVREGTMARTGIHIHYALFHTSHTMPLQDYTCVK
jgi:hypothetical protein